MGDDTVRREHPAEDDLPQALVFFLTVRDRARVLAALRRIDRNREVALRMALGIEAPAGARAAD